MLRRGSGRPCAKSRHGARQPLRSLRPRYGDEVAAQLILVAAGDTNVGITPNGTAFWARSIGHPKARAQSSNNHSSFLRRGDFSQHKRVHVHHAVLEEVQRQHADLVILAPVARELAAACEEDEVVGTVPLLDDVEPFLNFAAQALAVQVAAEEHGFHGATKLGEPCKSDAGRCYG